MSLTAKLVCGSPAHNHDFDFARRALLDALYTAGDIRTDVYNDYEDASGGDLLVSYTSQVPVSELACASLRRFLEAGGRWFAIHASNSVAGNPHLPALLGSRFIAHPPYMRYRVSVTASADPLVSGLPPTFDVDDELYVIEAHSATLEVLLHTTWGGDAMRQHFPEARRPLMYRHRVGDGGVLYLALGHCRRPIDKLTDDPQERPDVRGPWSLPAYQALIERGIAWAASRLPL